MEYGAGGAATRNVHDRGYELLSRRTDLNLAGKAYYHADLYGSPQMAADGEDEWETACGLRHILMTRMGNLRMWQ